MDTSKKTAPLTNDSKLSNITKRAQVSRANQMIFVWVAVASVVVVACAVVMTFLVRQAVFNQKIITAKSNTNATIVENISNAKTLKFNVDKLVADNNLARVKAKDSDSNLKVIFDALPTSGDNVTLANSLYSQIFAKAGVTTDSISVGDKVVSATATVPTTAPANTASSAPTPTSLPFQASIQGNRAKITDTFKKLELDIRPMSLSQFDIKAGSDGALSVSLQGATYYQSADSVNLGKTVVKP